MNYEQWNNSLSQVLDLVELNNILRTPFPKFFNAMELRIGKLQIMVYEAMANFKDEAVVSEDENNTYVSKFNTELEEIENAFELQIKDSQKEITKLIMKLNDKALEKGSKKKIVRRINELRAIQEALSKVENIESVESVEGV